MSNSVEELDTVGDDVDNRRSERPCGSWFPRSLLLLLQPLWDFSLLSLVKRGLSVMGTIGVVASIGRGNYCLNILLDFLIAKSSLLVSIQWLSGKSYDCGSFCLCIPPSGLPLDLTLEQEMPL